MIPKYYDGRIFVLWKVGIGFIRIEKETRIISASRDGYWWLHAPIEEEDNASIICELQGIRALLGRLIS
jgi:hypothetical protein